MICDEFAKIGEYAAMGAFEEEDRSLFYRKALGIRRYYENCELYEYRGDPLYPSGVKPRDMIIAPHYLNGLEIDRTKITSENEALFKKYTDDFFRYNSKVPSVHSVAGNMWCHSIPNYGRIINEGLNSYAERIKSISDADLREGLLHVYEGIRCYVRRCVDYLKEQNADGRIISALEKVPLEKADNIYEAVVSWNFVMYLDSCDNLGCLAKELCGFYNGDNIVPLLENLYDNLDKNDGYSMALHTADCNELTLQCLAAAKGRRRPMIELFVDENTSEDIWNTAFDVIRSGGGQPAFYNSNALLGELGSKLSIQEDDLKCFCGGGCAESMIAGKSNVGSLDAGINLLLIFEEAMKDYLPRAKSFDDFYGEYIKRVKLVTDEVTEKISLSQKERAKFNPLPMRTLLIDDCIDCGKEYHAGGAKYRWSIINFAGIVNVIDSMLATNELVFKEKVETAEDFVLKLQNNDKQLLLKCRACKHCFGKDDEESNVFAGKITYAIFSMLDAKVPYLGGRFLPASIQFMSQVYGGKDIGATPDGRCAGAPLCDSLAAIFGKDTNGPTALLKSVASIDLKSVLGTPILNFNIDENWSNSVLKALIASYMKMGGIQIQITCASEKTLRKAYDNPDMHKNVVVRVGGYSEYFYRLSDELKKMIIERSVQKI